MEVVQTTLRMERDLLARVDAAADERGVSRTYLISHLVGEGLRRLIPAAELVLTRDDPA